MAKELKYPIRRTARFSQEYDEKLVAAAENQNNKEPSVLIRELVEKGLDELQAQEAKSE